MRALKPLAPADVARRIAAGKATLVDVREPHEHTRERIAGAVSLPLSALGRAAIDLPAGLPVEGNGGGAFGARRMLFLGGAALVVVALAMMISRGG